MPSVVAEPEYSAAKADNSALREQLSATQSQLSEVTRQLTQALHQLAWFQRQLFGSKSEKQRLLDPTVQPSLLAGLVKDVPAPPVATEILTVTRRKQRRDGCVNDTGLRFDKSVPVRVIEGCRRRPVHKAM